MTHKCIGLVLASEQTYPGASLGIIHQIQEYARYTHSDLPASSGASGTGAVRSPRVPPEPSRRPSG